MYTLILLFSAVTCALIGLSLVGVGIYLMRSRSRQELLMNMSAQRAPQSYAKPKVSTIAAPQSQEQAVSSPGPASHDQDAPQRPDVFFMPLPAQLDSENEHSETTMIRNVLKDPDSETTLRPAPQPPQLASLAESAVKPSSSLQKQEGRRQQSISPLPDITENKSLPESLFPKNQREQEREEEAEDAPTTIFNSKS